MSLFYLPVRGQTLNRYIGLSMILHVAGAAIAWSAVQSQIRIYQTTGVEVSIRTLPGVVPRPGVQPMGGPALPSFAAPRRKIGRIIEKKYKVNIPKVEPQTALKFRHDDVVELSKDRSIAKLIRSENVELIDVERKELYKPPAPPAPAQASAPAGDYTPRTASANVDVSVQYVEIPSFEAAQINLENIQWKPAVPAASSGGDNSAQSQSSSETAKRRALKVIKPEIPPNLGIYDPKVEVILKIVIAESGFVSKAEIEKSGGYLELDNRALAAVRQWIYETAPRQDTRLVRVEYVF